MAIKRCPYCRAIIDEKDQYCNNCGTQLLFPDDEEIEEEIPGEKIIDESGEDKDYAIPEPGSESKEPEPVDEDEEIEEDEEPVIVADEGGDKEEGRLEMTGKSEEGETGSRGDQEEIDSTESPEETSAEAEERQDESGEKTEEEGEEKEEKPHRPYPLTFDTTELDKIGKTAEMGKNQVEAFLETLKQREEANRALRAKAKEIETDIPPWASRMSERGGEEAEEEREEETAEGKGTSHAADSGIGLPEKVTQAALPFDKAVSEETAPSRGKPSAAAIRDARPEEAGKAVEKDVERTLPPLRLSLVLKAKVFDLLFVAVFWLSSLWIAARSMEVTLFKILGAAPGSLFLYYAILLFFYFFLFYFFLGETLGDRLFRDAGES